MGTYNGTITTGGQAQMVPAFSASASVSITASGPVPVNFSWNGLPNGIAVVGTIIIDSVSNNVGLWPVFGSGGGGVGVSGPRAGQSFTIVYS